MPAPDRRRVPEMTSFAPQSANVLGSANGLESQRPPLSGGEMVRRAMDRMAHAVRDGVSLQPVDFFKNCIRLSMAVDNAIANNDIPPGVSDLPQLVKKVYNRKNDTCLRPAIMVLMFAIKNACRNEWFIKSDTDELLALSTEISSHFCKGENLTIDANNVLSLISKLITRFYPQFRMGRLIVSVEVKAGFSVLATDFYILRNFLTSRRERIRLFVANVNNLETSSCIASPPQVNFLINGIGVERRTTVSMETGAQLPTDITRMVKVGMNLLQAIGNFSSNYVIAVVVMTTVPSVNAAPLVGYIQSTVSEIPPDDELIEGPSKISLNCPISFQRIKNPVKGQRCKHLQCFDYENFMEINLRKPSWRCPHCNQSVDCTDLRIDQNMLKVLKGVGEGVSDVLISPDWSWKPCSENSNVDKLRSQSSHGTSKHLEDHGSQKFESVVDLTAEADDSDEAVHTGVGTESSRQRTTQNIQLHNCSTIDTKPSEEALASLAHTPSLSGASYIHLPGTTQSHDYQSVRNVMVGSTLPTYGPSSTVSSIPIPEVSRSALSYPSMVTPMNVETVATGPSRELMNFQAMHQLQQRSMQPGSQILAAEDSIQMQGSCYVTPNVVIPHSNIPAVPRDVMRVPSAFPPPSRMQTAPLRANNNAGYTIPPVSSNSLPFTTSNSDGLGVINPEWHQLRPQTNLSFSEIASTMPMHSKPQERHPPPSQSTVSLPSGLRNSLNQQMGTTPQDLRNVRPRPGPSTMFPHTTRQSELLQSFPAQPPPQHPSSNLTATARPPLTVTAATNHRFSNPRGTGNSWVVADHRFNVQVPPVTPAQVPSEPAPDQNWRPSRMRGSIDITNLNLAGAHTPSMVSQILAQKHAQQSQGRPPSTVPSMQQVQPRPPSTVPSVQQVQPRPPSTVPSMQQVQARPPSTVPSMQQVQARPSTLPGNSFGPSMSRIQPWTSNAAQR